MRHSLKLGTALSLTLMLPTAAFAQSDDAAVDGDTVCVELPLDLNKGQTKKFVKEAELPICGLADDEDVRAALMDADIDPDEMLEAMAEGGEAVTEEVAEPAEEAPTEETAEQPETDVVETEEAPETDVVETEDPPATEEAPETAEVPAADEPAAEEVAEPAEDAPADETETATEETPVEETGAETATASEEGESTIAEDTDAKTVEVEEDAAAAEAEAQAEAEAEAEEARLLEQIDEEEQAAREAERRAEREARQAEREARRAKRRELREAASALLLGTDPTADLADEAEVQTEEVTEETSRSSDETFAEVQEESASARAGGGDDSGDTLRKILGAAAAAAVVGAILDNGDEVVENQGDRVIVRRDGEYVVLKDENELLRRPGSTVETQTFNDGSSRTFVNRGDGTQIMTIRDADGLVLYRSRIDADGAETVLIDDRQPAEPVDFEELPTRSTADVIDYSDADADALRRAMRAEEIRLDRAYTLQQVREVKELRELMPQVDLDSITFDTGSAAIPPAQARRLIELGRAMAEMIEEDPDEVFMIEGHTDSVGSDLLNLALSDRRAESVALALTEYFDVPPENMIVQGYGEQFLKIDIEGDIRANRRATVRRITPLLRTAGLQ